MTPGDKVRGSMLFVTAVGLSAKQYSSLCVQSVEACFPSRDVINTCN